ncbi:MAG TPA: glycosyltransferase family 39 protein [Acidimicrobiales bacterium]|nr:glycosyltransferase family 39 protein [Acidimicrobiales bacterium]
MPDETPALAGRMRTASAVGVSVVVAAGLLLRFWTRSALWLDEALTVDVARLPLHAIPDALKHDGAPPLYYYLLHFWLRAFGQSNVAVRSLSGVLSVLTLPVSWLAGRRMGGRAVAWTTVVLVSSAPFAVYYATESRMYALVILLTGCGFLALQRAVTAPRPGNLVAVGVVTASLLYAQYWSLYLVGVVGIWLVASAIRSPPGERPWPALLAVVAGCLAFVPWLPDFLYQARHTGTPWSAPPNFAAVINAITGFTDNQGSISVSGTNQGRLLAIIYFAMLALALFGEGKTDRIVELDLHTRPRARAATFVVVGTLFAAIAGGILTSSAFSSRYAAVIFLPLLLLVALGTTTLRNPRIRLVVVTAATAAGLVASAQNVVTQRTQGPEIAAVIDTMAQPGDVVAFCPDQLGPSVYRLVVHPSRFDMVTFPRGTGPQIVDWVDYKDAVDAADPGAFARQLSRAAGATHHIWLVWQPQYVTYGIKCEQLASGLLASSTAAGGGGRNWVTNHPFQYYEPMNLTEYSPSAS